MLRDSFNRNRMYGSFEESIANRSTQDIRNRSLVKQRAKAEERETINRFLEHSKSGLALDVTQVFLATIFAGSYVATTYQPGPRLAWCLWIVDVFCVAFFIFDFVFRKVVLAESFTEFLWNWSTWVSLVVIIPVFPFSFLSFHIFFIEYGYWRLVFPFRFLKCYMEIKNLLRRSFVIFSPITQLVLQTYFLIMCLVLLAAGVIQVAETSEAQFSATSLQQWTYFDCLFFSVLTFATIGYPEASSHITQFFVGSLACMLVIIIPIKISKLLELNSSFSKWELVNYKGGNSTSHIVLCGEGSQQRIMQFLKEILHNDHNIYNTKVVIMVNSEPSSILVQQLEIPQFADRAIYLKGSLLNEDDLERAKVSTALAVFILSDKCGQSNMENSDHFTFMRCLAIRRNHPKLPIYSQIHLSRNRKLLEGFYSRHIVCFTEVLYSIVAQNFFCPGFSTLIHHLVSPLSQYATRGSGWVSRYLEGASHELYAVDLPPRSVIHGSTFRTVAAMAYTQCQGIILFGVECLSSHPYEDSKILINPGDSFICQGGERAFVIAKSQKSADAITTMCKGTTAVPHTVNISVDSKKYLTPEGKTASRLHLWDRENSSGNDIGSDLSQAVVDDVNSLNLDKPIVICSLSNQWPEHLEFLITPLRAASLKTHYPIVLVSSVMPTIDQWASIAGFSDIWIKVGDATSDIVLIRAGIQNAYRVAIFCGEETIQGSEPHFLDATTIATHKTILLLIGKKNAGRVIVEIINRKSTHYVAVNLGRDIMNSMANEELLLEEYNKNNQDFNIEDIISPAFASGVVYSDSLCDALLCNEFFNPMMGDILKTFVFSGIEAAHSTHQAESYSRSSLFSCEVPEEFIGATFNSVYLSLLESDQIVCLGLYRCLDGERGVRIDTPISDRPFPFGFVYINPNPNEIVQDNDLIYILAPRQPIWLKGSQ